MANYMATARTNYFRVTDEDDLLDDISDWLSDEVGFCHDGFELVN